MTKIGAGDVVVTPTDLLVISRDIQKTGAGLRSLAEPVLDTTGDLSGPVLAMLGVAAKLERRRIMERTARRGRDTTQRCPQLQRQSGDDFEAQLMRS
jgi:Resolvase, N terminal domain